MVIRVPVPSAASTVQAARTSRVRPLVSWAASTPLLFGFPSKKLLCAHQNLRKVCACACVRACVRVCVCACVRVCGRKCFLPKTAFDGRFPNKPFMAKLQLKLRNVSTMLRLSPREYPNAATAAQWPF